jgi:hypothetical protein
VGFNYWPRVNANIRAGERPDGEAILEYSEAEPMADRSTFAQATAGRFNAQSSS